MGFQKCFINQCLLIRKGEKGIVIVCFYIDDTMIVGNIQEVNRFKNEIRKYFKTKEQGNMKEY